MLFYLDILSHSPALADAMRVFLSKEDKDMVFKLREVVGYIEIFMKSYRAFSFEVVLIFRTFKRPVSDISITEEKRKIVRPHQKQSER